jgi:hexosaminidase
MPATENGTVLFKLESKNKNLVIRYMDDELKTASKVEMKNEAGKMQDSVVDTYWGEGKTYKEPIVIRGNNTILASSYKGKTQMSNTVVQHFSFNKATGRTITLVNQPSKSYPGNGAFTLVDGVQNEKGMGRSSEFLGFLGKDLDAMIDLNQLPEAVNKITIHVLDQNGSWIYLPSSVEVTYLPDMDFTPEIIAGSPKETIKIDPVKNKGLNKIVIEAKHDKVRYLHIVVKNFGNIPSGNPGAGTAAWLFVDEIEVE